MSTPDQTAAFDADAARSTEADELRTRLAELEKQGRPAAPEVINEDGTPASTDEVQDYETVEVEGVTFRYHTPKQGALLAFSLGASSTKDAELSMTTLRMFLRFHLLDEDFETLVEKMIDPESAITEDSMGDIINAMVESAGNSAEAKAPKNGPRV